MPRTIEEFSRGALDGLGGGVHHTRKRVNLHHGGAGREPCCTDDRALGHRIGEKALGNPLDVLMRRVGLDEIDPRGSNGLERDSDGLGAPRDLRAAGIEAGVLWPNFDAMNACAGGRRNLRVR